jgi:hypothetical protein
MLTSLELWCFVQLRVVDVSDAGAVFGELPADWPLAPSISLLNVSNIALTGPIAPAWLVNRGASQPLAADLPAPAAAHGLCAPFNVSEATQLSTSALLSSGEPLNVAQYPTCDRYAFFSYDLPRNIACKLADICPPGGADSADMAKRAAALAQRASSLPAASHLSCRATCLADERGAGPDASVASVRTPAFPGNSSALPAIDGVAASSGTMRRRLTLRRLLAQKAAPVSAADMAAAPAPEQPEGPFGLIAFATTGADADSALGAKVLAALFPDYITTSEAQGAFWLLTPGSALADSGSGSSGASGNGGGSGSTSASAGSSPEAGSGGGGGSSGGGSHTPGGGGSGPSDPGTVVTSWPRSSESGSGGSGSNNVSKAVIGVLTALGLVVVVALAGFAVWWKRATGRMGSSRNQHDGDGANTRCHPDLSVASVPTGLVGDSCGLCETVGDTKRGFGADTAPQVHGGASWPARVDAATAGVAGVSRPAAAPEASPPRNKLGFMTQSLRPFMRDSSRSTLIDETTSSTPRAGPSGAIAGATAAGDADTELGSSVALPMTRGNSLDMAVGGSHVFFEVGSTATAPGNAQHDSHGRADTGDWDYSSGVLGRRDSHGSPGLTHIQGAIIEEDEGEGYDEGYSNEPSRAVGTSHGGCTASAPWRRSRREATTSGGISTSSELAPGLQRTASSPEARQSNRAPLSGAGPAGASSSRGLSQPVTQGYSHRAFQGSTGPESNAAPHAVRFQPLILLSAPGRLLLVSRCWLADLHAFQGC